MSGVVPVRYIEDGDGVQHPIFLGGYIDIAKETSHTENNNRIKEKRLVVTVKGILNTPSVTLQLEQLVGRNTNNQQWLSVPVRPTNSNLDANLLSYYYKVYKNGNGHFDTWAALKYPLPINNNNNKYSQSSWELNNNNNYSTAISINQWVEAMIKPFVYIYTSSTVTDLFNIVESQGRFQLMTQAEDEEYRAMSSDTNKFNYIYSLVDSLNSRLILAYKNLITIKAFIENGRKYIAIWNWDTPLPLLAGVRGAWRDNSDNPKMITRKLILRFVAYDNNDQRIAMSHPFKIRGVINKKVEQVIINDQVYSNIGFFPLGLQGDIYPRLWNFDSNNNCWIFNGSKLISIEI